MADELAVGAIVDGRGGTKYRYKGGDRKDKSNYEMVQWQPEGKGWGEGIATLAYDAGGKVTDAASRAGSPPAVAAGMGYATNLLTQAVPSILSGGPVKQLAASVLQPAGRFMMRSALKPTGEKGAEAVETLLKEGINVTPGGAAELGKRISTLSDEVNGMIEEAGKAGVTVNKIEAAKRVKDALDKFKSQVSPQSDMAAIKQETTNFLNHPDLKALTEIPVELAQKIKSGTYKALGSKPYGEVGGASEEAQKALARGLKEEIERVVPGVKAPNAKQQELLTALDEVGHRTRVAGNKNPVSLGVLAENPGAATAFALDRSEWVKSILGRLLYSGAPSILGNTARAGTAGVMATTGMPE